MVTIAALCLASVSLTALPAPGQVIQHKAPIKAESFAPDRIRLQDGPFKTAQEADAKYLLSLEPNRFLAWFRKTAGLESNVEPYGGWERDRLAGHSLGHYLSACSYMFAATGDVRFKQRVAETVDGLKACQDARKDGYIAALPDGDTLWQGVRNREVGPGSFFNRYWAPWYTLHKEYAGLLDAAVLCGNKTALDVCKKFADWAIATTANLDHAQWQQMLMVEHGGMNEAMANLYGLTGDARYLELARKFHHDAVLTPLEKGEHKLQGLHGNTQIPKAIGCARIYELTGDPAMKSAASNFWTQVIDEHTYAIGGNTSGEHFGPPDVISTRLTSSACETCNTYNMLKLSRHLMEWMPTARVGDYYERALYNHILASQRPSDGMMCYYVSMQPGGRKVFSTPFDSFWCCVGTGMENHARYGDAIYFHLGKRLYVNLFVPSTLNWSEQGIKVRQETKFPDTPNTRLTVSCSKPTAAELAIRTPGWNVGSLKVSVNGKPVAASRDGNGWTVLSRTFRDGDLVQVDFTMALRLEPTPDNPKVTAICYGPMVLAADLGSDRSAGEAVPTIVGAGSDLMQWISKAGSTSLQFATNQVGKPKDVRLLPFYQVVNDRYTVYLNLLSEPEYQKLEVERKAEAARQEALNARTIDRVAIGSQTSERSHNLQGEQTSSGDLGGRRWRHASGWFSYDLKIDPTTDNELMLTFWGSDGGRTFDVLVDGTLLETIRLNENHPNVFFDQSWKLPRSLTDGKDKVTVRLQSRGGSLAGGLFGARTLRAGNP